MPQAQQAKYNHMFDMAFEVISGDPNAKDVTPATLKAALLKRIDALDAANEWVEACGLCDSYEMEN